MMDLEDHPMTAENEGLIEPLLMIGSRGEESIESFERPSSLPSKDQSTTSLRQRRQDKSTTGSDQPAASSGIHHPPVGGVGALTSSSRILDRDAAYFQSRGRWHVQYVAREAARFHHRDEGEPTRMALSKQFWDEWFHSLAYQRTIVLVSILLGFYAYIVLLFAFVYYMLSTYGQEQMINPDGSMSIIHWCNMDIENHMQALYFSLSTMTTIGYGVSDYYFGGCWSPLLLVLMQVCCGISFDAVATSLLFLRVSRGHKRGKTVLFSGKAVIRRVRGIPHLMFRVVELRRHQLHGASVRAYVIRHERHAVSTIVSDSTGDPLGSRMSVETVHYVTRPLTLVGDEAGSQILMSLPQVLVHRIDKQSPLMPPSPVWYNVHGNAVKLEGPEQGISCTLEHMEQFLQDREAEIIVVLEGADELTGASSQTRHSYATRDLRWNQAFVPCVYPCMDHDDGSAVTSTDGNRWSSLFGWQRQSRRPRKPVCVVDFARFHDTAPAPSDCESCPYVIE